MELVTMPNDETDVTISVGNQIAGIKISPTLTDTLWPGLPAGQVANDMRRHNKLLLVLLYVLKTGVTIDQANAAIGNHVTDID